MIHSLNRRLVGLLAASLVASALCLAAGAHPADAAPLTTQSLGGAVTPTTLANAFAGSGISVSNVTYTGANVAAGRFAGGTGLVGFDSGIALGSGSVLDLPGPNSSSGTTTDNGMPGDGQLNQLTGGFTTNDASVLEFDFIPDASEIRFQYVFSSEEYDEFVGSSYNDVFAFFVNGVNCARVPGTNEPVSVNTINEGTNGAYFRSNSDGQINLEHDGLTVVMTCVADVTPNVNNHIKLAIADTSDHILDAAVLLRADSLTATDKIQVASAWDGTNTFVVWEDYRNSTADIYGARVGSNGALLDPFGIPIAVGAGDQRDPAIAWNGSKFLVTWQDRVGTAGLNISGSFVSQSGSVGAKIALSTAPGAQSDPDVTAAGTNFLVVWSDARNNQLDIYGTRVNNAGTNLNPSGIALSRAAAEQGRAAISWNGTDAFVLWQDKRSGRLDIFGTRMTAAGQVLNPAGIKVSGSTGAQSDPDIAWSGSSYLAVWSDDRSGESLDVWGARITGTGGILNTAGFAVARRAGSTQTAPAVAWNGSSFLVAFFDDRSGASTNIYGTRVTAQGGVQNPQGFVISQAANDQTFPAVARNGASSFHVAWSDLRSGSRSDIYGTRVSTAGGVLNANGVAISQ